MPLLVHPVLRALAVHGFTIQHSRLTNGKITNINHFLYFTQTFENRRSPLMERLKPMLRTLTTIDFGRVTYEEDFREELRTADVELIEMARLGGNRARSYHIAVARPGDAPAPS